MKTEQGRVTAIKWSDNEGNMIAMLELGITFKGYLPGVGIGHEIKIMGKEVVHPKFGKQIEVEQYDFLNPTEEQMAIKDTLDFLHKELDLKKRGQNIFKLYGTAAKEIILANPYQVARDVSRIGFKIADDIAEKLGIVDDHPQRIEECVLHCLRQAAEVDGHVFVSRGGLVQRVINFTTCDQHAIDLSITKLCEPWLDPWKQEKPSKILIEEADGGIQRCYLRDMHEAEDGIVAAVQDLKHTEPYHRFEDPDGEISWFEHLDQQDDPLNFASGGINLSDEQRLAVRMSLTEKVLIITGGPGVGKTTIIKAICKIARHTNRLAVLCAPTGRAAKRMTESTGFPAATIHRTLEYDPHISKFKIDGDDSFIEGDIVICDETSMVDVPIAYALTKAVSHGARLVFVGDVDQLPPVGPGCFFRDLINSGVVPVMRLTKIYRQKEGSLIIDASRSILLKEIPAFAQKPDGVSDLFCFQYGREDKAASRIVELVMTKIPEMFEIEGKDIQVIAPMHKGTLGTDNLNLMIQRALHGRNPEKDEPPFFLEDRVIQNKNNYDVGGMGQSVMNGDIGRVTGIRRSKKGPSLIIQFPAPGGYMECHYSPQELSDLSLGYAITIHKAQGSQQKAIILIASNGQAPPKFYNRNMLYTALTRGEKLVIAMTPTGLAEFQRIIDTDEQRRNTMLAQKLMTSEGRAIDMMPAPSKKSTYDPEVNFDLGALDDSYDF
jgi:exodeoxyribonuclease V alpha subunit